MQARRNQMVLVVAMVLALFVLLGSLGAQALSRPTSANAKDMALGAVNAQTMPSPTPRRGQLFIDGPIKFGAASPFRLPPEPAVAPDGSLYSGNDPYPEGAYPPAITPTLEGAGGPNGASPTKGLYKPLSQPQPWLILSRLMSASDFKRFVKDINPDVAIDILRAGSQIVCGGGLGISRAGRNHNVSFAQCHDAITGLIRLYATNAPTTYNELAAEVKLAASNIAVATSHDPFYANALPDSHIKTAALWSQPQSNLSPFFCENNPQACAALDLSTLNLRTVIVNDGKSPQLISFWKLDYPTDRALTLVPPGQVATYLSLDDESLKKEDFLYLVSDDIFAQVYTDKDPSIPANENVLTRYSGFSGGNVLAQNSDGSYSIIAINLGVIRSCVPPGSNPCTEFRNVLVSKLILSKDISDIDNAIAAQVPRPIEQGSPPFDDITPSAAGFTSPLPTSASPMDAARSANNLCRSKNYIGGFLISYLDARAQYLRLHCTGLTAQEFFPRVEPAIIVETIPRQNAIAQWGSGATLQTVPWAAANRVAHDHCVARGYVGGYFNGNEDQAAGTYAIDCYTNAYAAYLEIDLVDIDLKRLGVQSLDTAPWWLANRLATGYCQGSDQHLPLLSGFFTGHRSGITGKYGLVCVGVDAGLG